ncbi:hypothetical protein NG819_01725 [Pseudarthrobacter sp. Fe7]|nr:hypothetical protein NG819_01725 [Pseudarthrobacter sp. Fe7]
MEAIGEDLGKADDAGGWLPRPAHLHAVPGEPFQPRTTAPAQPDVMAEVAWAEGLARGVKYLQLVGAEAVDRTRTQAISDAAAIKTRTSRSTLSAGRARGYTAGWNATGAETVNTSPEAVRETDAIDADGTEPTEETLRHTQGAFIRKPRHGLHHLEIFATTDQYEHLLTVMHTATNPRTTTPNTSPGTGDNPPANNTTEHATTEYTALLDLDRRTRAQKQLDGLITAAKAALATNTLPITGGNRPQIIAAIHYQDLFPNPTNRG